MNNDDRSATLVPAVGAQVERGVSALLLEAANDGMGIYPQATVRANGTREERTAWQDGWNAYGMQLTDKWDHLMTWWESLPREQQDALAELLHADGVLYFRAEKGAAPVPWILMNDTFAYACSDGEELPLDDLPTVLQLWREFKWSGLIAWAAQRRGIEPIGPHRGEQYRAAVRHLRANVAGNRLAEGKSG